MCFRCERSRRADAPVRRRFAGEEQPKSRHRSHLRSHCLWEVRMLHARSELLRARTSARRGLGVALTCGLWLLSILSSFSSTNALTLRIAADPNNLPFSNDKLEGFENKIADVIARELNAKLEYTWHAQRRGFFRETLKEGNADVVMGVPKGFERALTTKPYYCSSYVFVSRAERGLKLSSYDDPALRRLRIGVQLVGDDGANTPPAHELAARGLVSNLVGFTLYGDYAQPNPPARIVEAVANGSVDAAVVWGPLAGYFARQQTNALTLTPVFTRTNSIFPAQFEICIGVRKSNPRLRDRIDEVLVRRRRDIERILDDYGMPRIAPRQLSSKGGSE
jgi:mxaJ protein